MGQRKAREGLTQGGVVSTIEVDVNVQVGTEFTYTLDMLRDILSRLADSDLDVEQKADVVTALRCIEPRYAAAVVLKHTLGLSNTMIGRKLRIKRAVVPLVVMLGELDLLEGLNG